MPDQQLPPCGIGGQSVSGGPCSGTYTPSQAGQDAFSTVSSGSVVSSLLSAGVILAGVLFVVWIVYKVAGFFGGGAAKPTGGEPGTMEWTDKFWEARGREANASRPDAEFHDYEDDREDDTEDDSPALEGERQGRLT